MTNARDKANIPVLNFQSKGIDDNATSTAITIDSSERVGLGRTPTNAPFEIQTLATDLFRFVGNNSQGNYMRSGWYKSDNSTNLAFLNVDGDVQLTFGTTSATPIQIYSNNSERLRITSAGNVGIGETAPLGLLHVKSADSGASANAGHNQVIAENSGNSGMSILSGNTSNGAICFGDDGNNCIGYLNYTHDGNHLDFGVNGSEKMRIASNGMVGIGTTNPQQFLDISDNGPKIRLSDTSISNLHHIIASEANDLEISCDASGVDANSHIRFKVDGSEKVRFDSSGNVGIGTTAPASLLHLSSTSPVITFEETDQSNRQFQIGSFGNAYAIYDATNTQYRYILDNSGNHIFNEGGLDCDFRVESNNDTHTLFVDGGNDAVIFGDGSNLTPAESSTAAHACIPSNGRMSISASSYPCLVTNRVNSEGITIQFRQAGGVRGSISVGGASTSYNTSSDYRLKENVSYDFDATTKLKQLKPARFNWISDETKTLVDGFIAHEVSDIIPEAVIGTKDAVDENGNIEPQGIDQSKLVPLLVKTIQELEARITTLETNNP